MTQIDPSRMAEATRLTRAGRLAEATALLRGLLPSENAGAPAADWAGPTLDLRAEPPASADGQWLERSYANPFGSRRYKLFVPATATREPRPLLVMLHGCTQDPDDFAKGTRMNQHAAAAGVLVAYPGQSETANPSKCWNWFQPTDQERGRGEPSLIAGIARQVMQDRAVDPTRVYVAGLSAGGAKAAVMAATYPDLFAAAGVHSGLAHGAARDMASAFAAMREPGPDRRRAPHARPLPVIVVHGDHDGTVHPGNGEAVIRHAVGSLAPRVESGRAPGGHAWTRTRYDDPAGRTLAEHWQVHGLGHAWSGGDPAGSYTDPRGPDASRAMLDFLLLHRGRPGGAG